PPPRPGRAVAADGAGRPLLRPRRPPPPRRRPGRGRGRGGRRMKIASVADVKARLSAFLKESEEGPVIITRNGKAVAVLLAVTDDDELERLVLAHSPKFRAILE